MIWKIYQKYYVINVLLIAAIRMVLPFCINIFPIYINYINLLQDTFEAIGDVLENQDWCTVQMEETEIKYKLYKMLK
ncbi:hypothetical protein G6Z25_02340 [Clostridium perfringens]|uniref:hypothetical protein n=1 Tax=Clostridium perfringens TaxID=1502 RepID=UPI0013E3B65C|nr:hypothetical protein [Clostridium perfringens]NGS95759.1 hypothetical protein [Clostridium perfringens]